MSRKLMIALVLCLVVPVLLAACGQSGAGTESEEPAYSSELVSQGEGQYQATCSACHGADGQGVENLGVSLVDSQFVRDNTDAELLEYVKVGRAVDDPLNTTGIAMPPKGGNPALTDDQITAIIAYIRSIQE